MAMLAMVLRNASGFVGPVRFTAARSAGEPSRVFVRTACVSTAPPVQPRIIIKLRLTSVGSSAGSFYGDSPALFVALRKSHADSLQCWCSSGPPCFKSIPASPRGFENLQFHVLHGCCRLPVADPTYVCQVAS